MAKFIRISRWIFLGAILGTGFGAGFGILASAFRGGPAPIQGVLESLPFFATAFAFAGMFLALEKPARQP